MFKSTQNNLASGAAIGFLAGLLIWLALIIQTATVVRSALVGEEFPVAIGPLTLNVVSKQPVEADSFRLAISVESGLLLFLLLTTVTGIVVAWASQKYNTKRPKY